MQKKQKNDIIYYNTYKERICNYMKNRLKYKIVLNNKSTINTIEEEKAYFMAREAELSKLFHKKEDKIKRTMKSSNKLCSGILGYGLNLI